MQINTKRVKAKRTKRMPEWERNRDVERRMKFTMIDRWFDRSEPAEEALEKHMGKRFDRYDRHDVFYR